MARSDQSHLSAVDRAERKAERNRRRPTRSERRYGYLALSLRDLQNEED